MTQQAWAGDHATYRITMLLHSSLYLSMPMAMTSLRVLMPAYAAHWSSTCFPHRLDGFKRYQ